MRDGWEKGGLGYLSRVPSYALTTAIAVQRYAFSSYRVPGNTDGVSESCYDTIRYDTRCYINVRSKANMSQLNLPHGTDN